MARNEPTDSALPLFSPWSALLGYLKACIKLPETSDFTEIKMQMDKYNHERLVSLWTNMQTEKLNGQVAKYDKSYI